MHRSGLVTLVGLLSLLPALHVAAMTDAEKSKVRGEIESLMKANLAAASAGDLDGCFAPHSSSPDYQGVDNGTFYGSMQEWKDAFREGFAQIRSQDIRVDVQEVLVLAPDLAAYAGHGTLASTFKSGPTTPRRPFAWTLLWRREGGQWKVIQAHQSFCAPETKP